MVLHYQNVFLMSTYVNNLGSPYQNWNIWHGECYCKNEIKVSTNTKTSWKQGEQEDVESYSSKSKGGTEQINWWKLSVKDIILKLYVWLGISQHVGRLFSCYIFFFITGYIYIQFCTGMKWEALWFCSILSS